MYLKINTIKSRDNGGVLNYEFYSHGQLKSIKNGNQILVSNEYDSYGRQTKLIDINAGTTMYEYDNLNQRSINKKEQVYVYGYFMRSALAQD